MLTYIRKYGSYVLTVCVILLIVGLGYLLVDTQQTKEIHRVEDAYEDCTQTNTVRSEFNDRGEVIRGILLDSAQANLVEAERSEKAGDLAEADSARSSAARIQEYADRIDPVPLQDCDKLHAIPED